MYNNSHFKANNQNEVIDFMNQNPFVVLCGVDENNRPIATHIPVLIEESGDDLFLLAHVMRKQLHTIAFEKNNKVLVIFSAAHTYVSANNYTQQNTASTWNYQAVHVQGDLFFLNKNALFKFLVKLTEKFEQYPHSAALVQKMDEQYVEEMMKAIVAFEIKVTNIEHVFKLSQNKDEATQNKIINNLEKSNDIEQNLVAKSMKLFYKK